METIPPPAAVPRSRREFMANVVLSVGTALGLGGLAFRFVEYLYPIILPVKMVEVPAGNISEIPADGVRLVHLPQGPVMLEKTDSEVHALSAICTHLGCIIAWNSKAKEFICPCHGGRYNLAGEVVFGPPPRPLEKLQVKVRDGQVFVLVQSIKEEVV